MEKPVENIAARLKEMIGENGPDYLKKEPYNVYRELIKAGGTEKKTAGAVLCFLVSGMAVPSENEDPAMYSKAIQKACGFNKKIADQLTEIFRMLYSDSNQAEWRKLDRSGLRQFLKEDYSCKWNGYAVWDEGNGTVDCFYEAEIVIKPTEEIVVKHKELDKVLTKNPFTTKTEIQKLFERSIQDYLESEFKEYCECDDYYQPVVEDFDAEYSIKEWCGKNGFIFISCVGKGSDGGYDPKFRRGWY